MMNKQFAAGIVGAGIALGVGGYLLAGSVTDYELNAAADQAADPAAQLVYKIGDEEIEMAKDAIPEASAKNLLGVLLSGGAEIAKKDSRKPAESAFRKVGSFRSDCTADAGAKKCSVFE